MIRSVKPAVDYLWFHCVGVAYQWNPDKKVVVFADGAEYTLDESLHLSKGKLNQHAIRTIHNVKKALEGEILTGTGFFDHSMPDPDPQVPEVRTPESLRPVPQEFYGRRTPRTKSYTDPNQGVLSL